jgi:hypothetical protein
MCPTGVVLFHAHEQTDGRTDRQTDRLTDVKKLIIAFRNFANAPNKEIQNELNIVTFYATLIQQKDLVCPSERKALLQYAYNYELMFALHLQQTGGF